MANQTKLEIAKKKLDNYAELDGVKDGDERVFYLVKKNLFQKAAPEDDYQVIPKSYADQLVEVDSNGIPKLDEQGNQIPVIKPEDILYTKNLDDAPLD